MRWYKDFQVMILYLYFWGWQGIFFLVHLLLYKRCPKSVKRNVRSVLPRSVMMTLLVVKSAKKSIIGLALISLNIIWSYTNGILTNPGDVPHVPKSFVYNVIKPSPKTILIAYSVINAVIGIIVIALNLEKKNLSICVIPLVLHGAAPLANKKYV